jgi:hypothetical protein
MSSRPPTFRRPTLGKPFGSDERPSAAKRGYGRAWRAIRADFLRAHPICACGAAATEVDHVISLRRGGSNAPSNLQAMCKACHARKTVAVDGALGNGKNLSDLPPRRPIPNSFSFSTKLMFDQMVRSDGKE